jgi:16S rRNA (guanine966-N2)-methyltransferase
MSKSHRAKPGNQVRIIGGDWRGRKLQFPSIEGLRPTPDRVRETLFNWLSPHIVGAHCLDLYAGSGALGFEALSRGARSCCFIDNNKQVQAALGSSVQALNCESPVKRHLGLAFGKLQHPPGHPYLRGGAQRP